MNVNSMNSFNVNIGNLAHLIVHMKDKKGRKYLIFVVIFYNEVMYICRKNTVQWIF